MVTRRGAIFMSSQGGKNSSEGVVIFDPGGPFVLTQIRQPGNQRRNTKSRQENLLCSQNIKMNRRVWYL